MFAPIASYERYLFPSTNRKMDHHDDEYHAGGELHNKPSDEEAVARLEEIRKSIEGKMALRQSNLNSERPDDFTHHNIDVACNLLETCGRFLYQSPETTVRMANMLEILIMRLKNVKILDPRHATLVEKSLLPVQTT
ncbi:hypothetical protein Dsin_004213 [Dipteronia sinensis]|uniref:Uncharacterized protein n=1 Tax=Dipteronia sinensis TaxID=43782 RepID=A0AAE0BAL7_9ROSI|nr:hypothetical protein Dsin_004213 [Dipteronia sinensis]